MTILTCKVITINGLEENQISSDDMFGIYVKKARRASITPAPWLRSHRCSINNGYTITIVHLTIVYRMKCAAVPQIR